MKRLICLCLSVVIILCSCAKNTTQSKPEDCLQALFDFTYKGDFTNARQLAPDIYWEKLEKDMSMTYNEILTLAKGKIKEDNSLDKLEERYGKDYKITYEIVEKEQLEDAEIEHLKTDILHNNDYVSIKVDDAMKCEVEVTISGKGNEDKQKNNLLFVKCGDKWYIYFEGVGFAAIAIVMVAIDFTWE